MVRTILVVAEILDNKQVPQKGRMYYDPADDKVKMVRELAKKKKKRRDVVGNEISG